MPFFVRNVGEFLRWNRLFRDDESVCIVERYAICTHPEPKALAAASWWRIERKLKVQVSIPPHGRNGSHLSADCLHRYRREKLWGVQRLFPRLLDFLLLLKLLLRWDRRQLACLNKGYVPGLLI